MRGCVEPGDVQKGEEMERFNKKQGASWRSSPTHPHPENAEKMGSVHRKRMAGGGGGKGLEAISYIYILPIWILHGCRVLVLI
jgi:hypothetical protein